LNWLIFGPFALAGAWYFAAAFREARQKRRDPRRSLWFFVGMALLLCGAWLADHDDHELAPDDRIIVTPSSAP